MENDYLTNGRYVDTWFLPFFFFLFAGVCVVVSRDSCVEEEEGLKKLSSNILQDWGG